MALIEKSPFERFLDTAAQRLKAVLRPVKPVIAPFKHPARDVVMRQDGPRSGVWFEVIRRPDGLFSFTEWRREMVSAPKLGTWEAEFPLYESGLYATPEEAKDGLADYRAKGSDEQA